MAIKVLALASGVTGLADQRGLKGALAVSAGTLQVRGGVFPGAGGLALSTVSAMVARVAAGKVLIPNTVSSALGPYLLVSDANVDITFDAGEAGVGRVDRIIARAYDDANDGSGSTLGNIYYLKGTAGGAATALPSNSLLLYEMTIPAGASAGGGGVNFANAVDQRVYTAAAGGVFTVANNTQMAAVASPYEGMIVYRTDLDALFVYDGTNFKLRGIANVSSSANLSTINNPYDGAIAVTRDTDAIYVYNGSAWVAPKIATKPVGRLVDVTGGQSITDGLTPIPILFGSGTEEIDSHSFHSTSSNTSRVTPTVAGYYRVHGAASHTGQTDWLNVGAAIMKNGSAVPPAGMLNPGTVARTAVMNAEAIVECNGSTDYFEVGAISDRTSNTAGTLVSSGSFKSVLEWEFIGATTY